MEILNVLQDPELQQFAQRPEIQENIRNVDVENFMHPLQVKRTLDKYKLLASGSEAMVFLNEEEVIVVRMEYTNSPLQDFLKNYIQARSETADPEEQKIYAAALRRLNRTETEYEGGPRALLERIAAHNRQYVKDPTSTIPINGVYAFNNEPFAVRMRYLDGRSANSGELTPEEKQLLMEATGTDDPTNFMVDIKNSAIPRQLIDVRN